MKPIFPNIISFGDDSMRLLHFSDTHLGFSEYHKIDPVTGLNQREQDFYNAWEQVIKDILEIKPDVVVHAGDLFHTSRPTNRAIRIALFSLQQINDAGIPFVVISGNHSTPRIQTTGSIFESIDLYPNVFAAYQGKYERFRIDNVDFHCVPHCSLSDDLEKAFNAIEIQSSSDYNILVTHGAWSSKNMYSMGEFNEQHLPDPEIIRNVTFDYIALGHYHRRIDVKENACYSGSTERTSFNEYNSTNGYLVIDLEKHKKEYFQIKTRPMIKLTPLNCAELTVAKIYTELEKLSDESLHGALVNLSLTEIHHDTLIKLDTRAIDEIFSQVFHLEKQFVQRSEKGELISSTMTIDSLPNEFERYLENIELKDLDKNTLIKLGSEYLSQDY